MGQISSIRSLRKSQHQGVQVVQGDEGYHTCSRVAVESLPTLIPIRYVRLCGVDAWCGVRYSEASVKTLDICGRPQQAKVSI